MAATYTITDWITPSLVSGGTLRRGTYIPKALTLIATLGVRSISRRWAAPVLITPVLGAATWHMTRKFYRLSVKPAVAMGSAFRQLSLPASTIDGRRKQLGHRPILPVFVRAMNVNSFDDMQALQLADGESFVTGASYVPRAGETLQSYGAQQGSVGTCVYATPSDPLSMRIKMRAPEENEVVWLLDKSGTQTYDNGLYRWDATSHVWREYLPLAVRAMLEMTAFEALDPDNVYPFIGRLLGAVMARLSQDNAGMRDFMNPDKCPENLLGYYANQLGLSLPYDEPVAAKREHLRLAIPMLRESGQDLSVAARLRLLGYRGYVREVWVDTTLDTWTTYTMAPPPAQADIGARDITLDPDSGDKCDLWYERPHGHALGDGYVLTARVVIHLNQLDGSPLPAYPIRDGMEIKRVVAKALRTDCLPAHVDIRQFATDLPASSACQIRDSISVTRVLGVTAPLAVQLTLGEF